MKKFVILSALLGSLLSVSAASWHYADDGCTKIYQYGGYDSSECFDKKRDILKQAGRKELCNAGYYSYCY